jgi:hypothetical protein
MTRATCRQGVWRVIKGEKGVEKGVKSSLDALDRF